VAALATAAQLAARLQKPPGSLDDDPSAALALDNASGLVRALARQELDFVSQETTILTGGERILALPQRPVVVDGGNPLAVVELGDYGGIDFTMLEGRDFVRTGDQLKRGYPWWYNTSTRLMGWPWRRPLGVWAPRVRVTYSHGYQIVPDVVVGFVLSAAATLYTNPGLLRSFTIDDYNETYATETLGMDVASLRRSLSVAGVRRGSFSVRPA
jgi:hypothetical protein